ncbi:hypothetical protein C7271_03150 [filamentous cyanobacterium CCP5]|nr:hypothetical protein C7271_03150 [filamentous cyanobacterium CCP5]
MIKANGFNTQSGKVYGSKAANNPDGLEHLIAVNYFDQVEQVNYVVLGYEDLFGPKKSGGSDRDFNDVVFAVRGIQEGTPTDVPEPSIVLGLMVGFYGLNRLRRRQADSI